ncbi:flagellar basal-body MS-ring/collar protein FliF [[Clostridium] hylemonae]|uniref:Flagellar M-ring protein FliF n=1 Tax=[Clostridium] hylemonae DSM 15053 TaxID=553973 RepID=C0C1Q4_9FIRM|nr:flagellar basal-body MS-ring/collar protein FliF [[Clostridium] hylemonae]EEG74068.1 flagellar M-ring protein FliF [[Clostridium] hylemonae DSM 15053]QEK19455.1 Flagellar M-ring protein [[Clostridium] hylemonae DSM 15053]
MDKIKLKLGQLKDFLGKYSKKTKIIAGTAAVAVIAAAVIIALVLNHKDYTTLFTGVTEEEATKIIGKLQESGVDFQYKENGDILVDEKVADKTRADLVYEGYPKSGFTYDVFTENSGGMTTDSEKETYKLYDLQDRIGATIRFFDGVKDAKVNIALKEEQKYVLEEDGEKAGTPSASVVVTMESGESPSEKQAAAIQRLVAKSVPEMEMENVAVFDGNGIEVSVNKDGSSASGSNATEEIAQLIEMQISKKVINVLGSFYGAENIRVSARGKVNMEKVIRESTTYTTPEKIDEKDKTGIVSSESTTKDTVNGGGAGTGVAGSETNADTPEYNAGTDNNASGSASESATRDYLVNQVKEQGELDTGVLEDLTVSVAINGKNAGNISMNELRDLVGNATGIAAADRLEKITIVNAPFYEENADKDTKEVSNILKNIKDNLPVIAVAAVIAVVIIILAVILIRRRRKRRMEEEEELEDLLIPDVTEEIRKPEILNLKNEKSRELRENVRDFADENPEISAQMIRNWLNGGEQDGRKADE